MNGHYALCFEMQVMRGDSLERIIHVRCGCVVANYFLPKNAKLNVFYCQMSTQKCQTFNSTIMIKSVVQLVECTPISSRILPFSTTPLSFDTLLQGTNPHKPYIVRNYSHWATSSPPIVWVYFRSNFRGGLRKRTYLETEYVMVVQGHPRSLILAPIESEYATSC